MYNCLLHLKNGLSRKLPEDHFKHKIKYGRLRDNLKYLYPSLVKNWKTGIISGILLLLGSILTYPQPMITRFLIDDVLLKKKIELLIPVIILFAVIGISSFTIGILRQFYNVRFSQEVILNLQEKLMNKVLSLPKLFFDKNRSGYLMSRVSGDVQGVSGFISGTVVQLLLETMRFAGGIFFLFYLEWRLAIAIAATLPLPFLTTRFFARRSYIMSHHNSELNARANATFMETISSAPLIKAFATEERALGNLIGQLRKRIIMTYEQTSIASMSQGINRIMPSLARIFVLLIGSYWVIEGQWEIGSLIAFQAYLSFVYTPINHLSNSITQLQSARATLDRVASLFDMVSEDNTNTGLQVEKLKACIEFKNVSFAYDVAKPVLSDISFKINPGEHWAIIGSSGIGKTTLISLLLKFYKPQAGEILFDNIQSSEFNVRSLRRRIGYVSQSVHLQSGTILENLKYGNQDATDEDVVRAATIADIDKFIDSLPDKYETFIEENGDNLSEGQKQRIGIARALIRNPDIIILDEPTSALDNATENSICEALPESVKNKTTITIAHRLSTIKSADKIIFLRKGKAPLTGTHDELMTHKDFVEFFTGTELYD